MQEVGYVDFRTKFSTMKHPSRNLLKDDIMTATVSQLIGNGTCSHIVQKNPWRSAVQMHPTRYWVLANLHLLLTYLLPPSLVNARSATIGLYYLWCNPFASHISAQNGGFDNGAFNISLPPLPARNDISPPKPYHLSLSGDSYYAGLPDRTIPPYKRHWRSQQRRRTSSQFATTRDLRLIRVFIGHRNLFWNIFVNF